MAKLRVYQLANKYEIPSKAFVDLLNQNNIPVKNHMSMLTDSQVEAIEAIKEKFQLNTDNVQKAIDKQQKIEDKEKAAKEKAEADKKEALRQRKMRERAEIAKATREQQEAEIREAREIELKKKAQIEAEKKKEAEKQLKEEQKRQAKEEQKRKIEEEKKRKSEDSEKSAKEKTAVEETKKPKKQKEKPVEQKKNQEKTETIKEKRPKPSQNQNVDSKKENPQENMSRNKKKQKFETNNDRDWEDRDTKQRKEHGKKDKKNKANAQTTAAPLKVRDHSKKGKTSHASYKKQKAEIKSEKQKNQVFEIPENITVGSFAETLDIPATDIIRTLMMAGTMASINQEIDFDTAALVAEELGYKVEKLAVEDVMSKILEEYDEADTGNAIKRPPVVTVMGHVDHGKTSLLDRIRKANVTSEEAGGITQHIGAYTVTINGEKITFIDTPGHEAFTAMRLRGAQMTDIAVLVVAADDGVMPQTVEAINHAKAADVPIIVAINKIDKDGANPDRVKQELTEHNLVVEEWGGDIIAVPVSAKKGIGIEDLLENILLVAEVEELTADPKRAARGCVIEAQMKQGKGSTASLLVQQGTLEVGDTIISGMTYGKIRTMIDDKGRRIKKAGPSQPVEISGLSDVPVAGDDFIVLENEKEARQLAEQRQQQEKESRQLKSSVNLNDLFSRIQDGEVQDVNIIIKADVQGSVEAIAQSLMKLNTEEVRINVVHGAVGAVNESDVMLASTSQAIIIGFNVRPDKNAIAQAEAEQVDIRLYRVIYDAIEDVKKAMEGLLSPDYIEKTTGSADVREVFRIPGGTMIAGSYVTEGKIGRNDEVRIIRDGIVVFEGKILSLRRFKDDVKEVNTGFECGIGIEKFNDIKVGDVIETFVMEAVAREL